MSLLDDLSDFIEGVREMGQELDAIKVDIVNAFVEPVKDLSGTVNDASKDLMGHSTSEAPEVTKNLPPAGE